MAAETTFVYLVRHAHAGSRQHDSRDIYRPLTPSGQERAQGLAELFASVAVDRLVASPATRCQQTMGPLAHATGLDLPECPELWEGSSTIEALDFLGRLKGKHVVACSHGDIIPAIIDQLGDLDVPIKGRGCELGSVWILERGRRRNDWRSARYVGPRCETLTAGATRR